jgi:hypothetical protein
MELLNGSNGIGGPDYKPAQNSNTVVAYVLELCLGEKVPETRFVHDKGRAQGKQVSLPGWTTKPKFPGNPEDIVKSATKASRIHSKGVFDESESPSFLEGIFDQVSGLANE